MSSQHNEDAVIKEFFGEKTGKFLDIGAYEGRDKSNTFALAERGWSGVCVEASPQCFVGLQKTYDQNHNVLLVSAAVASLPGCLKFYDHGGATATLSEQHKKIWEAEVPYEEIYVAAINPHQLHHVVPGTYDFLSLDIEGESLNVLAIMDMAAWGFSYVCVEAYTDEEQSRAVSIMEPKGFTFHTKTVENMFFRRS